MTPKRALVIVPTYNEPENLPVLVAQLMQQPNVSVMVVDDQSPDDTGAVADALAREYRGGSGDAPHRRPRLGRSTSTACRRAARPVRCRCQMDADLSHDPRHLPALIAASDRADIVIGSRYVPGGEIVNWPKRRRMLSRFANSYIRLVTRLSARDCTSGYRCWRREALASIQARSFTSEGYSFLVEMLYAAAAARLRFAEVPITFIERRLGESKLSRAVLLESAITPWRLIAAPKAPPRASS